MPGMHTILYNVSGVYKESGEGEGRDASGRGRIWRKKVFLFKSIEGGGAWYSAYTPLYSNHSYNILVENKELQTFLFF